MSAYALLWSQVVPLDSARIRYPLCALSASGQQRACTRMARRARDGNGTVQLLLHFEGFEPKFDEWVDLEGSNRFPFGGPRAFEWGAEVAQALGKSGAWRDCHVVCAAHGKAPLRVHFDGFDSKYDLELPRDSDRLRYPLQARIIIGGRRSLGGHRVMHSSTRSS